jgi:heme oxygenase (mycobilin-producing)
MITVMNCVTVDPERAADFERAFLQRERLLDQAPGFRRFELLRRDRGSEYVVLTTWESEQHFQDWLKSDSFARAHRHVAEGGGQNPHGFAGQSEVRSYEILDSEEATAPA